MNRNLVGSIYGRASIKIAHSVLGQVVSREEFLEIDQSEKRIVCGGHVC
jgi:hypothetical protein